MKSAPYLHETGRRSSQELLKPGGDTFRVLDILLKYKYFCSTSLPLINPLLQTVAINKITLQPGTWSANGDL